jgi:putative FmdB family regulatory protein
VPVYSFRCTSCNVDKDMLFSMSKRPKSIDCDSCSGKAKRVFKVDKAQSNDPWREKTYKTSRTRGLVMHMYKCNDCDKSFDELIDFSKGQHWEDKQTCPSCSSTNSSWIPTAKIDRFSEQFPYFDRGLGVMLKNKQHRLDICKARGLTPVDGDWDVDKEFSKMDSRLDREEKEYADYCDRLDNHPAFRQYRESQDKGLQ